jgi:hypothetical protein
MRTRERELLDWNLETAHHSAALCHLGNISYRLGKEVPFSGSSKPFGSREAANETFGRMAEHLKDNGLKLENTSYRLGRLLKFDGEREKFLDDPQADALLGRPPRPPFTVPEKVV